MLRRYKSMPGAHGFTRMYVYNTGANPTIASYNGGAVKMYNATSSLVRFEIKFFLLWNTLEPSTTPRFESK
jgi:hypothetical protein